jgi:hypothetical protein
MQFIEFKTIKTSGQFKNLNFIVIRIFSIETITTLIFDYYKNFYHISNMSTVINYALYDKYHNNINI